MEEQSDELPNDPPCVNPNMLPGIKLPRTASEWEEANLFFKLQFEISGPIKNLSEYTAHFQQTIYNYFASNFGTVSNASSTGWFEKYNDMTIKNLKKSLHDLKKAANSPDEIIFVSKLLRRKLDPANKTDVISEGVPADLRRKLKTCFWKTCDKIFQPVIHCLPMFSATKCFEYFARILKKRNNRMFDIPDWIPLLGDPSIRFDLHEPTYAEISKAVKRSKGRASPCPFDMISILIAKRCPYIRTVLQKIISECWNTSSIPACWSKSLTKLIYKKGDPADVANFRPITLQPALNKVMASVLRNRLYSHLNCNKFIDKHVQKGFWPAVDGVVEWLSIQPNSHTCSEMPNFTNEP